MNYADSSLLVSLYVLETHSDAAEMLLRKSNEGLWFTPLHRAEWEHAISRQVLRASISSANASAIEANLESDFVNGTLAATPMPDGAWGRCADLARDFGRRFPIRTLDTLHVACALELGVDELWTFDRRQATLAERAGLRVRP